MQVAVIGAGVVGVSSAYYLSARGHEVTVIDGALEPAMGASHANGGQLSYSFTDALARPSFLTSIPRLILGRDPGIAVRLLRKPPLTSWGLRFLRECTASRARSNTVAVLELAMRSATRLAGIREQTGVEFAFAGGGKLVLLPAGADLAETRKTIALKKRHGCETTLLSMQEAAAVEPMLEGLARNYAAAVHSEEDEVGDARKFTQGLAQWLTSNRNTRFMFDTKVESLITADGRLRGVATADGPLDFDAVVVCAGVGSCSLLRPLGVAAPIYPVRGYSITLPRTPGSPRISITDVGQRILYCPLGNEMRVSGFADFLRNDDRRDSRRIAQLVEIARQTAPGLADYEVANPQPWAGARPMTPNGRPLTGATRMPGLFINCGHGTLGWTLAAATGHDVAAALDHAMK